VIFNFWVILTQSNKHLSCSFRMTNIINFILSSMVNYIIESIRSIKLGHVLKCELPIWIVYFRVHSGVVNAVSAASIIAKPNVKSPICHHKTWSLFFVMKYHSIGRVEKSMLIINYRKSCSHLSVFCLNSVEMHNIAIFSCNIMRLYWII